METPQELIRQLAGRHNLTEEQAAQAMNGIMEGQWTPSQIGAYLTALHMKGETLDEVVGSARVMREKAFKAQVNHRPLVDTAGTGGDALHTINVSTLAALVAAGAGVHMAKHGNRAVTGMCGSADILEGLGAVLEIPPQDAVAAIDETGFGFLFAPAFHQSMKHAVMPRREIGVRSIFNLLGPLTNPLGAEAQLIGVAKPELGPLFTQALIRLGCPHSMVVAGADGMDEISNTGESRIFEQKNGQVKEYTLTPEALGCQRVKVESLRLSAKEKAVDEARALLDNRAAQAPTELVLMNAAAAIYLGGGAASLEAGMEKGRQSLASGQAKAAMERFAAYTQSKKQ